VLLIFLAPEIGFPKIRTLPISDCIYLFVIQRNQIEVEGNLMGGRKEVEGNLVYFNGIEMEITLKF